MTNPNPNSFKRTPQKSKALNQMKPPTLGSAAVFRRRFMEDHFIIWRGDDLAELVTTASFSLVPLGGTFSNSKSHPSHPPFAQPFITVLVITCVPFSEQGLMLLQL